MPEESQKIGGMDKKYWYVIGAVAGIVAYLWWRSRAAAAANTNANAAIPIPTGGTAGNATTDLGSTGGVGAIAAQPLSTISDWITSAQQWATGTLGSDPALVQNALQAYANGTCLSQAEFNIVDKAIGQFGSPPDAPYQGVVLCGNQTSSPVPKTPVATKPKTGFSIAGYQHVATPQDTAAYQKAGIPIFALPAGMALLAGNLIPYNTTTSKSLANGSSLWIKTG